MSLKKFNIKICFFFIFEFWFVFGFKVSMFVFIC